MQAVKICADAGTPLPPETVIRLMEGYRSKEGGAEAIRENGQSVFERERRVIEGEAFQRLRGELLPPPAGAPSMREVFEEEVRARSAEPRD